eukprot:scaffold169416_cov19-Prasinocladus_malaysianus.AAC.1
MATALSYSYRYGTVRYDHPRGTMTRWCGGYGMLCCCRAFAGVRVRVRHPSAEWQTTYSYGVPYRWREDS